MKRDWQHEELLEHFNLSLNEAEWLRSSEGHNLLGLAVQLKCFQYLGYFVDAPESIPMLIIEAIAGQLGLAPELWTDYDWQGRTAIRHRAQIRKQLGFRPSTLADAKALLAWLETMLRQVPHANEGQLKEYAYHWLREAKLEPPTSLRLERLIHTALANFEVAFTQAVAQVLSPLSRQRLDDLLFTAKEDEGWQKSVFAQLKQDPQQLSLKELLAEIEKLKQLRQLQVPSNLFQTVAPELVKQYRRRAVVEAPSEMRQHADHMRYTLLAAFIWMRQQEVTDNLVELFMQLVHRTRTHAERRVDAAYLAEIKQVRGKGDLLARIAEAALDNPEGTVREVIFPVVSEQALRDLLAEYQATGTYHRRVYIKMRSAYGMHYRRLLAPLLETLVFRSSNPAYHPILEALDLLKRYLGQSKHYYPHHENVPLVNVVPSAWYESVIETLPNGRKRINRINYEIVVLHALRDALRNREIWVEGAKRFRNINEDLLQDFSERREFYYGSLHQPLHVEDFIQQLQTEMHLSLSTLDAGLPDNPWVEVSNYAGHWIKLTQAPAQPEPPLLGNLHRAVEHTWGQVDLLDILKETELRLNFTETFHSVASREMLDPETRRRRLLFCLYGLGTNVGIKAVCRGENQDTYDDLLYVKQRFILKESLQNAVAKVTNATFTLRQPHIWGAASVACASDSRRISTRGENLKTGWHARYRTKGVMLYWHVERQSLAIFSQVTSPGVSEVAAMMQGVLRHLTTMQVQKNYVDTHGQNEVAFAFAHLLGFDLLPRLKGIHQQVLYRPYTGQPDAYPHLQAILTRPIHWELIRQQYEMMIQYALALRFGTADAESILRRFTKTHLQHPTYLALVELGRAVKTIYLARYLHSLDLRQEIQEGLNMVENWHSTNQFIAFGNESKFPALGNDELELRALALHLLQNSLIYINTMMVQHLLNQRHWSSRMTEADWRGLTPLFYSHVNPYGFFHLNMETRLPLLMA